MAKRIKVGGRELALVFTVAAMDEIEELLGAQVNLSNLQESIVARLSDRHDLVKIVYAMARQGEYAMDCKPDFDLDWLKRHMRPGQQMQLHAAVVEAMAEGLTMETGGDDGDEVDVVLEEIKKKRRASA